MESKLKVIIVDDHDMFREGVKVLLRKSDKIEVIGEAANGKEFLDIIPSKDPDVVLMDISMPVLDGIEASRLGLQIKPELKILVLSMFGEEEYYYKMIQSGVRGFVMKSAGIDELEFAINQVAEGSAYFSEELLDIVKQNIKKSQPNEVNGLTTKELQLLKSIALNMSDSDTANELNESLDSIEKIRTELLKKTGILNPAGLVMYAIKNKIVGI
jgi:DNA-binding NarL/FixJ family response regulator